MSNRKRYYSLPDYKTVTQDPDVYTREWRNLAAPIERELGLTLVGFDPTLAFQRTDPNTGQRINLDLPVWFAKELATKLNARGESA